MRITLGQRYLQRIEIRIRAVAEEIQEADLRQARPAEALSARCYRTVVDRGPPKFFRFVRIDTVRITWLMSVTLYSFTP